MKGIFAPSALVITRAKRAFARAREVKGNHPLTQNEMASVRSLHVDRLFPCLIALLFFDIIGLFQKPASLHKFAISNFRQLLFLLVTDHIIFNSSKLYFNFHNDDRFHKH